MNSLLGKPPPLYLDHAATTPLGPGVADVMARAQRDAFANPSSQHAAGRRARQLLEECRERVLAAMGGRSAGGRRDRLVFTSGASEANRLAMLGAATTPAGLVATSARDHASLRLATAAVAEHGWRATSLPLDAAGTVDHTALAAWAAGPGSAGAALVATTLVCGQTGTIEDLGAIAAAAPRARIHADATQAIATEAVSFAALPVATLAFAPHKFGGPRGIGALIVRHDQPLAPLLPGTQETGLRGGTEPVALAAGFAHALDVAVHDRETLNRRLTALRDRFEASLRHAASQQGTSAHVIGSGQPRAAHISVIAFPGHDRQAIVMAADLAGLCCATGSACSSGSSEPAPALVAMGLPADVVRGAVRFSFAASTTEDEIERAGSILSQVIRRTSPRVS